MSRLDYGAAFPEAIHRFAQAGSRMAIDNAPVDVEASGDEPVVIDFSHTSMLQVLAAELREADLLGAFELLARQPHSALVQEVVLPKLRAHDRIASALSLTWTADQARDVAERLIEAADVAESDPAMDGTSDDADASDDLHLSGYQS